MLLQPVNNTKLSAESSADLDGCVNDWLGATNLQVQLIGCHIPSAEVIRQLNSWVIVLTKDMEHILHCAPLGFYILHCAPLEFYLVDNLCNLKHHSFENMTPLSNPQTGSHLWVNYPQNMDYFSEAVSVVRHGGNLFGKHFRPRQLQVDPVKLLSFELNYNDINTKKDGSATTSDK
jgi:hypothetical protein